MPKVFASVEERRSYFTAAKRTSRGKKKASGKDGNSSSATDASEDERPMVAGPNLFVPIILPEDEEVVAAAMGKVEPTPTAGPAQVAAKGKVPTGVLTSLWREKVKRASDDQILSMVPPPMIDRECWDYHDRLAIIRRYNERFDEAKDRRRLATNEKFSLSMTKTLEMMHPRDRKRAQSDFIFINGLVIDSAAKYLRLIELGYDRRLLMCLKLP